MLTRVGQITYEKTLFPLDDLDRSRQKDGHYIPDMYDMYDLANVDGWDP